MGIPGLYRWLRDKYPLAMAEVVEERPRTVNGVTLPIDTSRPNPNGIEFDNLYLDMNGIIHPCFHPEGLPPPANYEEVFESVFVYIDKLFAIVRPRKLLYLAIDGVAPRAKMNQQRSRRFRAAKEAADEALRMERRSGDSETEAKEEKEEKSALSEKMDSNIITPGTEFMDLLSSALRYYIHLRMNGDPGWQGIKVILSDATVPGEGEHKIMSYIRLQRDLPGYDPNTRHCLYGLDADLIMLALATHEVHFTILREDVSKGKIVTKDAREGRKKGSPLKKNHRSINQQKESPNLKKNGNFVENVEEYLLKLNFQFLNIWVLREYLEYDMKFQGLTFKTDLERLIDDFVFMCIFVGNDFLPHIPTLAISEGAVDLLMTVYKKEFLRMGGYLTNSFEINITRVEHFIQAVSSHECAIFRKRMKIINERKVRKDARFLKWKIAKQLQNDPHAGSTNDNSSLMTKKAGGVNVEGSVIKSYHPDTTVDMIQLGEEGWKERYYAAKFEAKTKDEQETVRRHAVFKYIEGICWVMRYYFEGVCSWQWFYPYHYAPFASDFYGLDEFEIQFTLGEPFKPFDQLMGVLPSASAHALPLFYRKLMTDASSPILDFYPSDFELDKNGKRYKWQAICKLPFIEESRLLSEIAKVEHTLTDDERRRNSWGLDVLFVHISHPMLDTIISKQNCHPNTLQQIDAKVSGGMNGFLCFSDKPVWPEEVHSPIDGMQMIAHNKVLSISYKFPLFHYHISRLPQGVILPGKSVTQQDISPVLLWHETVVSRGVSSRRPIYKSLSGSRLANLAHRLVSSCIPTKKQDSRGFKQHGFHVDTFRLGGIATKINAKKEKCSSDNKISFDRECEGKKGNEDDRLKQTKTGIQSQEEKERLRKREQSGDSDVLDKNVVQLDHFVNSYHREGESNNIKNMSSCTNINELASSIVTEKRQRVDVHTGAEGVMEIKRQVKSKKRKRKCSKKKLVDVDNSCAPGEQKGVDGGLTSADGIQVSRNAAPSNNVEKLDHSDFKEWIDGSNGHVVEINTKVKSKKRKRKSRKRKQVDIDTGHAFREQIGGDGGQTSIDSSQKSGNAAPSSCVEKVESSDLREQIDGSGGHVVETKTGVKSKKRKRKSRKKKQVDVDPSHASGEQRGDHGGQASFDASQERKNAAPSNSVEKLEGSDIREQIDGNNDHVEEIKTQMKSKKRKRKSRKIKQVDVAKSCAFREQRGSHGGNASVDGFQESRNASPRNNVKKLEHSDFRVQGDGCNGHAGANGLEMHPAVTLERKEQISEKEGSNELSSIQNGSLEIRNRQNYDENKCLEKLEYSVCGKKVEGIVAHLDTNKLEIQEQTGSKKKRRRSKRRNVLSNSLQRLESGVLSKQVECEGHDVGANGLVVQLDGIIPNRSLGEVEAGVAGKQGGGNGCDHVGLGAAAEMKTQVKSRRRKPRPKKKRRIEADDVPKNAA